MKTITFYLNLLLFFALIFFTIGVHAKLCYYESVNIHRCLSVQFCARLTQLLWPKQHSAVAEWSKALLLREKINKTQKDPRFAPGLGTFKKTSRIKRTRTSGHRTSKTHLILQSSDLPYTNFTQLSWYAAVHLLTQFCSL